MKPKLSSRTTDGVGLGLGLTYGDDVGPGAEVGPGVEVGPGLVVATAEGVPPQPIKTMSERRARTGPRDDPFIRAGIRGWG
jgi:hypothetical protein